MAWIVTWITHTMLILKSRNTIYLCVKLLSELHHLALHRKGARKDENHNKSGQIDNVKGEFVGFVSCWYTGAALQCLSYRFLVSVQQDDIVNAAVGCLVFLITHFSFLCFLCLMTNFLKFNMSKLFVLLHSLPNNLFFRNQVIWSKPWPAFYSERLKRKSLLSLSL